MHVYGVSVYYAYTGSQLKLMDLGGAVQNKTQRPSESRISPSLILRAATSLMPKKLKRLANLH